MRKFLFSALLIGIYLVAFAIYCFSYAPVPKDGVLDITHWDIQSTTPILLNGEWEYYWNQLLSPQDLLHATSLNPTYISILSFLYANPSQKGWYTQNGYATLRLIIKKKKTQTSLVLKLDAIVSAYKLWVDGDLVATVGTVGKTKDQHHSALSFKTVFINSNRSEIELVMQISDYSQHRIINDISLMSTDGYIKWNTIELVSSSVFLGVFLIFGFYHLVFFLLRQDDHKESTLFFSLCCFLLALFIILTTETGQIVSVFSFVNFNWLSKGRLFCNLEMLPVVFSYFYYLYPNCIQKIYVQICQVFGIVMLFFLCIFPLDVNLHITYSIYFPMVVFYIYLTVKGLILAAINHRKNALLNLFAYSFFLLCIVNDLLYSLGLIHSTPLISFGFSVFILFQAYILSDQYSFAYQTIQIVSAEKAREQAKKDDIHRLNSTILHELKNNALAIKTTIRHILGVEKNIQPRSVSGLNSIVTQSSKLFDLSRNFLYSEMADEGLLTANKTPFNVCDVLQNALKANDYLIQEKMLTIHNGISAHLTIYADKHLLYIIFNNLINNAAKYSDAHCTIWISATIHSDTITFIFMDEGEGIPDDMKTRIFDRFTKKSSDTNIHATGLGLNICQHIAKLHHGQITLESRQNEGTTVSVTIQNEPIASVSAQSQKG